MTTCARCSQAIKNAYIFRGKPYGPDCIEVVTGQRPEHWIAHRDGVNMVIDEKETAEAIARVEAIEAQRQARVALHKKVYGEKNEGGTYVTCQICHETRCTWNAVGYKHSDGRCYYCADEKRSLPAA